MSVQVDIEKKLGSFHLRVKFEAGDEVLALLGASGCGKSMTLKCIAGIVKPDRGRIVVDDEVLFDSEKNINLSPQVRHTGLMFQNYALFPNMNVLENIRAGTRRERKTESNATREARVKKVMETFGLLSLARHLPSQLSGGQQQRTALARILVSRPSILLLDEPFSALDSHLRFRLEQEVREVMEEFGKSVILVSHNRDEVYRLSDKIAVMDNGRIVTCGDKKDVFHNPRTRHAAILTGCKNISKYRMLPDGRIEATDWGLTLESSQKTSKEGYIGIRMHGISDGEGQEGNVFLFNVLEELENPFSFTIMLQPDGKTDTRPLGWELTKEEWHRLRAPKVKVQLSDEELLILDH